MKFENYSEILEQLSDDNLRAEAIVNLTDKIKSDEVEYLANIGKINDLTKINNQLRDTNSKLALRVTGMVPDDNIEKSYDDIKTEWLEKARN